MDRGVIKIVGLSLIFVLAILLLPGCGDEYCDESATGMPLVGVYALGTPPEKAQLDSVTIYGVGQKGDSVLYKNKSKVSEFYTPLNILTDSVEYVVKYESKLVSEAAKYDTLTYKYEKVLQFDEYQCGATYKFVIEDFKYTTHSIKYAELIAAEVNSLASQTVRLYYVGE